jgi:hypothetical protein
MRTIVPALCAVLMAGSAWAGGTSIKMNAAALPDYCDGSSCNYNTGVACSTNAECVFGSVSPKSKISLTGTGQLTVQLKSAVDVLGAPVTGDYVLRLSLVALVSSESPTLLIKVPVEAGKGKTVVDVSGFFAPAGDGMVVFTATLHTPADVPGDCPGDNDVAGIEAREASPDGCLTGDQVAVGGITYGGKTSFKASLSSFTDVCNTVSGVCYGDNNIGCATNTDCEVGSVSPKSKASIAGSGLVKITVKDVIDDAGLPATGNYLLYFLKATSPGGSQSITLEVPVADGKGKATVDLSSFLGSPGAVTILTYGVLATQPAVTCPSGNTPADITARSGSSDCLDGLAVAVLGVRSGL